MTEPSSANRDGVEKQDISVSDTARDNDADAGADGEKSVHLDAQAGVQQIEAVTSVWTTTSLIVAYVMIWIIYFVILMQQTALATLTTFVTSAFAQHSLTPTVTVISSIIGGVSNLTLAKILDVFGRQNGYLLSLILATIGLIMMAVCRNVEQYAAAEVFYTVGQNSLLYTINIFVADTSSLRNRGFMTAFASSPNIITTWLSGPISEAYLEGPGWRWAFGTFAIVVPVVTLPLYGLLTYNGIKAKKQGIVPRRESQRTAWQSFVYYCREFDAVGLLLLSGGLALFLLPFNIYSMQGEGWRAPIIICFLVFGLALILAFVLWERWFAPVTFIPYSLLLDRTVFGACVLGGTLFISYYSWASFFSSFLMVVNDLDVTTASYVTNAYSVGTSVFSLAVGYVIHRTGRFRAFCLWFGIPLSILGMGLMIYFRQPENSIGYVVMCQILIAAAAGAVIICDEIAVMAAASHQYIAVVLAIESLFSSIGGAIGLTVASAIWQSTFPTALAKYLPAEDLPNLEAIYADINTQLLYPVGTPTRIAIQHAYGDAQKMMLIAGTAIWVVGFIATFAWRDIDVRTIKQVKGNVV